MEHSRGVGLGRRKAGGHGANVVPMYEILKNKINLNYVKRLV